MKTRNCRKLAKYSQFRAIDSARAFTEFGTEGLQGWLMKHADLILDSGGIEYKIYFYAKALMLVRLDYTKSGMIKYYVGTEAE